MNEGNSFHILCRTKTILFVISAFLQYVAGIFLLQISTFLPFTGTKVKTETCYTD